MKFNKRTSVLSLFLAGVLISGTVAAADIIIGDGYNGAKQALKYTTKTLAHKTDSFSASVDFELKYDGEVRQNASETVKLDLENQQKEETNIQTDYGEDERISTYYTDSETHISKTSSDEMYYQTNYSQKNEIKMDDPFENDMAKDFEKVADAFISNMKDFVQVNEGDDGSKLFYGSLESSQMPAFATALSSFFVKYAFLEEYNRDRMGIPELSDNLCCNEVTGKVSQNSDGLIDSMVGTAVVTGTDKQGDSHTIELTAAFKLWDVNSTSVDKPQLSDDVIVTDEKDDGNALTSKDAGIYKSDIVSIEDDTYVKVGERILTVNSVNDNSLDAHLTISGGAIDMDCDITAEKCKEDYNSTYFFEYTDASGEQKNGLITKDNYMNQYGENLMVHLNVSIVNLEKMSWRQSDVSENNFLLTRIFE